MDRNWCRPFLPAVCQLVRLVRACGSKQSGTGECTLFLKVRLVRACGSKPSALSRLCGAFWVRLVRACGSKPDPQPGSLQCNQGQARKSLWIETASAALYSSNSPFGQARKSLWIETMIFLSRNCRTRRVRLVRACGSKPGMAHSIPHVNWVRLVRACGSKL